MPGEGSIGPQQSYHIEVLRRGSGSGTVVFSGAEVTVETDCWWNPDCTIEAGTYHCCSKTRMATSKDSVTGERRPAIFMPHAVAPDTGRNTIFLHEGNNPADSKGCIVMPREQMLRILDAIHPADARNVTVIVRDVGDHA